MLFLFVSRFSLECVRRYLSMTPCIMHMHNFCLYLSHNSSVISRTPIFGLGFSCATYNWGNTVDHLFYFTPLRVGHCCSSFNLPYSMACGTTRMCFCAVPESERTWYFDANTECTWTIITVHVRYFQRVP